MVQNAILKNRRRFKRYPCDLTVEFHFDSPDQICMIAAVAKNISSGGMLVESESVPKTMTPCRVQFNLPDWFPGPHANREVMASATVLHANSSRLTFGIAFSKPL